MAQQHYHQRYARSVYDVHRWCETLGTRKTYTSCNRGFCVPQSTCTTSYGSFSDLDPTPR
jgi:hypothetical protein